MDELEKEFEKINLKYEDEEEQNEQEKISHRKLRYLKMKDKKDEKKRNKQNSKIVNNIKNKNDNKNEDEVKRKDDDDNNIIKEDEINSKIDESLNVSDNIEKDKKKYEPVFVEYCKICGMPYEYCEYGKFYNECKEENKEKYNYDIMNNEVDNNNKKQTKKIPKISNQKITIQKTTRARKKVVTVVTGLHTYVKLEKIAKIFSRFYACGSSVIKGTNNNPDQIDIQGDVEHNIAEIIMKNCPEVTEDKFVFLPPK
ncbi:translation initiation factor SUI1, putative [Plasmodium gallinaceum]|uniref:Translation initiation factor SUI1, putative n=1 Tax=Plasmodium gallinaceum TaxID=5849 RepID=A0A1J1GYW3_PLAGA|nr:translation initiation factor SUI1, putative [Plasmodium gallinaceum]CRG97648.1 translation initiation factor SUI1, putative [Plasmodium gallinaceum]